tara:strand:+ start:1922 stop:2041 length:120 start_codon:yes stop_codon:yes gene_type:complete
MSLLRYLQTSQYLPLLHPLLLGLSLKTRRKKLRGNLSPN